VQSVESQPTFQRNVSPSSGLKNKPGMKAGDKQNNRLAEISDCIGNRR
jgi:hypothetical protein